VEVVLPMLINELTALPQPVVLVLDDYHVIRATVSSTTRSRTCCATCRARCRWRSRHARTRRSCSAAPRRRRGARAASAELRFSDDEAEGLLNRPWARARRRGRATAQARTEGWPAGLQLAALSLRDQSDRSAFVHALAGDDRRSASTCTRCCMGRRARRDVPSAHVDPRAPVRAAVRRVSNGRRGRAAG
jgi:LuxR family maltose regulon positive regulatory protein